MSTSQNPRFQNAIEALRSEPLPSNGAERALGAFQSAQKSNSRRGVLRTVPALAAVAVVGVYAFWPSRSTDQVFAQAMKRSSTATKVHQWVEEGGRKVFENWLDGEKFAMTMMYGDRVDHIYRTDGKHLFYYYGGEHGWTGKKDGSNAFSWSGELPKANFTPPVAAFIGMTPIQEAFPIRESLIMQFFRITKTEKPVQHQVETVDGKSMISGTYPLQFGPGKPSTVKIYIDRESESVARVDETTDDKIRTWHFEYPNVVDPANFKPMDMKGAPHFSMQEDREHLLKSLKKGVATKTVQGIRVKLLAVVKEPRTNAIMVLWDGLPTSSQGDQAASILGNPTMKDVTPSELTTSRYGMPSDTRFLLEGTYTGSALMLNKPVGQVVDVQIPVLVPDKSKPQRNQTGQVVGYVGREVGKATFHKVPVMTVGSFIALRHWTDQKNLAKKQKK